MHGEMRAIPNTGSHRGDQIGAANDSIRAVVTASLTIALVALADLPVPAR